MKSFCLDIKKKMNALKKLYSLVRTMNMNDDNEETLYGISTNFIRKLTDLFFRIISEKSSKFFP